MYIYNDSYLIFIEASNLSHVNKKLPELNRGEGLIAETLGGVIFSFAEKDKQPSYLAYRCEVGSYNSNDVQRRRSTSVQQVFNKCLTTTVFLNNDVFKQRCLYGVHTGVHTGVCYD